MKLSRRDLTRIAAASALATQAAPAVAFFHNRITPENLPERLAADLTDMLKPGCDGSFMVTSHNIQDAPFWYIDASIQMNWPPGLRRRLFAGGGQDIDQAYAELLKAAQAYFGSVWTMPDGSGCLA